VKISNAITIECDGERDEGVQGAKYHLRLNHPIVVQFTEVSHRTHSLLVVLGMVYLHTGEH